MDQRYMDVALEEAKKAYNEGNTPVGAVIVHKDTIIAKSHNTKNSTNVATHHAELLAIEKACKKLKTWRLNDCTMYVTLEPCSMCYGAIAEARIKRVVYIVESKYQELLDNSNNVVIDKFKTDKIYEELLKNFFKEIR